MTWFLEKLYRRVYQQIFIGVCPLIYIRGLSTKLFIGVRPLIYIGGLTNKFQYRRLSNEFSKTNIFVLKIIFPYMENACVRESVRARGMGHDM